MIDPSGGAAIALADAIGGHAVASYVAGLLLVIVATAGTATRLFAHEHPATAPASRAVDRTRVGLVVILVASTVFLLMTDGLGAGRAMGAFDTALAAALSCDRAAIASFSAVFATVTHLADRSTLIALTVVVAAVLAARREVRLAVGWTLACGGNGLLNPALKHVFERARPTHDAAYATTGPLSFPSGHTSGAVVCYGLLAYVLIRHAPQRWRARVAVVAAAVVFTIAFSRVLLQVHWASDVLAGLASGTAWLTICVAALEAWRARETIHRSQRPGIG